MGLGKLPFLSSVVCSWMDFVLGLIVVLHTVTLFYSNGGEMACYDIKGTVGNNSW